MYIDYNARLRAEKEAERLLRYFARRNLEYRIASQGKYYGKLPKSIIVNAIAEIEVGKDSATVLYVFTCTEEAQKLIGETFMLDKKLPKGRIIIEGNFYEWDGMVEVIDYVKH